MQVHSRHSMVSGNNACFRFLIFLNFSASSYAICGSEMLNFFKALCHTFCRYSPDNCLNCCMFSSFPSKSAQSASHELTLIFKQYSMVGRPYQRFLASSLIYSMKMSLLISVLNECIISANASRAVCHSSISVSSKSSIMAFTCIYLQMLNYYFHRLLKR